MTGEEIDHDYTFFTFFLIILVAILTIFYSLTIDLFSLIDSASDSFQSSSLLILLWRISCLSVGISAVVYMIKCGPGNMRVISIRTGDEIIEYPTGLTKFVTFSSWTLLANVSYFLLAVVNQILLGLGYDAPGVIAQVQVVIFCVGIAMAFLTATIVRHIILPDEIKIGRNHDHMFLFHEQIMHNFSAVFLALELVLLQPILEPQFAIIGLIMGLIYVTFAYLFAYFGGGYIVYSFLHPKPKIAPILVFVLAGLISLSYTGLWYVSTLNRMITIPILAVWVSMIVQFRPAHSERAKETI